MEAAEDDRLPWTSSSPASSSSTNVVASEAVGSEGLSFAAVRVSLPLSLLLKVTWLPSFSFFSLLGDIIMQCDG